MGAAAWALKQLERARTKKTTATGPAFDKTWLTLMIQHHEGAITMAKGVATTSDADVKALATAIVDGQQKEITTMKGLLG